MLQQNHGPTQERNRTTGPGTERARKTREQQNTIQYLYCLTGMYSATS